MFRSQPVAESKNIPLKTYDFLGKNYLSIEFQIKCLQGVTEFIRNKLKLYLPNKESKSNPSGSQQVTLLASLNLTLQKDITDKSDNNFQSHLNKLMVAISAEIECIHTYLRVQINKNKTQDNVLLIGGLVGIINLFKSAKALLNTLCQVFNKKIEPNLVGFFSGCHSGKMNKVFDEIMHFCEAQKKYLYKAIDVQVYQVQLPKSRADKILAAETFHFEGSAKALLKTIGGTTLAAGSLVVLLGGYIMMPVTFPIDYGVNKLFNIDMSRTLANVGQNAANMLEEAQTTAFAVTQNIAPEFIERLIKPVVTDEGDLTFELKEKNPYYREIAEETEPFYILHAGNVQDVYRKGTNFFGLEDKGNPSGCVILCREGVYALNCALAFMDGEYYDALGGWHIKQKWSDEERLKLQTELETEKNMPSLMRKSCAL